MKSVDTKAADLGRAESQAQDVSAASTDMLAGWLVGYSIVAEYGWKTGQALVEEMLCKAK